MRVCRSCASAIALSRDTHFCNRCLQTNFVADFRLRATHNAETRRRGFEGAILARCARDRSSPNTRGETVTLRGCASRLEQTTPRSRHTAVTRTRYLAPASATGVLRGAHFARARSVAKRRTRSNTGLTQRIHAAPSRPPCKKPHGGRHGRLWMGPSTTISLELRALFSGRRVRRARPSRSTQQKSALPRPRTRSSECASIENHRLGARPLLDSSRLRCRGRLASEEIAAGLKR